MSNGWVNLVPMVDNGHAAKQSRWLNTKKYKNKSYIGGENIYGNLITEG